MLFNGQIHQYPIRRIFDVPGNRTLTFTVGQSRHEIIHLFQRSTNVSHPFTIIDMAISIPQRNSYIIPPFSKLVNRLSLSFNVHCSLIEKTTSIFPGRVFSGPIVLWFPEHIILLLFFAFPVTNSAGYMATFLMTSHQRRCRTTEALFSANRPTVAHFAFSCLPVRSCLLLPESKYLALCLLSIECTFN